MLTANNEAKSTIFRMKTKTALSDYERTLNYTYDIMRNIFMVCKFLPLRGGCLY